MVKRRVLEHGPARTRVFTVDDAATKGATIGVNLYHADGSLVTEAELSALGSGSSGSSSSSGGLSGVTATLWRYILEKPKNIVSIAALATLGFAARVTAGGDWALRKIVGAAGRIRVAAGDGVGEDVWLGLANGIDWLETADGSPILLAALSGDPLIDLEVLADSGNGELLAFERDDFGRVSGTRPHTPYDLASPLVQRAILLADFTIESDYQLLVYNRYDIQASLVVDGELVVL